MEDEIDIYADLPNFNLEENENLAEINRKITEKCAKLENQVTELTQNLESLKTINRNLEVNLSSLLKTAKAEIARKDRMIADVRRQLEDMQFRRGNYSKSVDPARRSPLRKIRGHSPEEKPEVVEVREVPDTTEFVCDNPPPGTVTRSRTTVDKPHQLSGFVPTVFGERLRKRILEEQEEERKRKEQSKAKSEQDIKNIPESDLKNKISDDDSKTESNKLDSQMNSDVGTKENKSSLSSNNDLSSREDNSFTARNPLDRKRQCEDQQELVIVKKRLKIDNGRSRYRDNSRRCDRGDHKGLGSSAKSKSNDRSSAEVVFSDDRDKYQIVDEYLAPDGNDPENKSQHDNDVNQERHNRVAIRLMLLAEGIDPDLESKKKKIVGDEKEIRKRTEETYRSRSKSRNRHRNLRSRSRTPDDHRKNRKRSTQRDNRSRKSKDRFDKRRDSRNRDGDNLSEFSREICELKERIEYRVDDRPSNRIKDRGLNRHKRNDERDYRNGRSGTLDGRKSGSKERMMHKSRADKQSRRSRSRERHKSKNSEKCYFNVVDIVDERHKTDKSTSEKPEMGKVTQVSSQAVDNLDTKSLQSLEEGEIVDSRTSSPVKTVDHIQTSPGKNLLTSCGIDSLDTEKLTSKITELKSSLPLQEIENIQNNEGLMLLEQPASPIVGSSQSTALNDSFNSSKDERIENIAEFIANFSTCKSESKQNEESVDNVTRSNVSDGIKPNAVLLEEKITVQNAPQVSNTVFIADSTSELQVVDNNNTINSDDHWSLIALDSPVKNFEENRKTRMMAQSILLAEKSELSNIASIDEPSLTDSKVKSPEKMDSESVEFAADKISKPMNQGPKNTLKAKPAVLKSLRSTYHKGKKEMILSDTNSEQCAKIAGPNQINSDITETLGSDKSRIEQRSEKDIDKPLEVFKNIEKRKSKSPVMINADRNYNSSQRDDKKEEEKYLFGDPNDVDNVTNDEKNDKDVHPVIESSRKVESVDRRSDEARKSTSKSKENILKTRKETIVKIVGNSESEIPDIFTKETKSKQTTASKSNSSNSVEALPIGSKLTTFTKLEINGDNEKSDIGKCSESRNKSVKTSSKTKVDGTSNSKQKKEPRKLVVFARRRKPVHLEDSSTSSSVVISLNAVEDETSNCEKIIDDKIKPSNTVNANCETEDEQNLNESQKNTVENDCAKERTGNLNQ